jgi:hypothetical protein
MGSSSSVPGEVIQKMLDDNVKKIDELNLQIEIYQRIMLEEMQNPTIMPQIINNFEDRYTSYSTSMKTDFNTQMNNKNYITLNDEQVRIVNIIFDFGFSKINVVTPTIFKLNVIYETALNKLENPDNFKDINEIHFSYNSDDISNHFVKKHSPSSFNFIDKGVISVVKKNNITVSANSNE